MPDHALLPYLECAMATPGWRFREDLIRIGRLSSSLPRDAVLVEVGCLFGRSSIMLAAGRKLAGSGKLHCVDPFDMSGDAFSVPYYQAMVAELGGGSLLAHFLAYTGKCGLSEQIEVHRGTDHEIGAAWNTPIDLLLLDGDQSRLGARRSYEGWIRFLKPGGWLVLSNSADRTYAEDHDGHAELFRQFVRPPAFRWFMRGDTTYAQRA